MPPSTPKPIDPNKRYTMNGQEVKILSILGDKVFIATRRPETDSEWYATERDLYGRWAPGAVSEYDLVEVPETKKLDVWVNVYPDAISTPNAYFDQTPAHRHAGISRIACVHVVLDYKVGEGLS